ncbi:MAG: SRPBCC family protein [Candidatus Nanopelagicales bacterium]|jgi:carbon monoxide dehydrogenase subunit G
MDLQNSFVVPADIDTAWRTLLDVEAIAPCMPGATLETVDGDSFTGSVKVKLGPVNMTYGGKARFVEKDEAAHRAVIEGTGKETRGSGTASALVTAQLIAEAPDRTRVEVNTDLTVTGKPAQFGRGVMQDVAGRIIDQFSANLAAVIAASGAQAAAASAAAEAGEPAPPAPAPAPLPQAADSIDLLGTAGAPVLKRAIPAALALIAVIGIIWLIARRRDE